MTHIFDKLSCVRTDIINKKYLTKYCAIIEHYLSRTPILDDIHKHHIIPRCMMLELCVKESTENLVNLTPREHKFVHKILSHAFPCHDISRAYNLKYQCGVVAVIDTQQGKQIRIATDEYYSNRDRYKTHSTGFTNLFTPDGINMRVSVSDVAHLKSIGWTHVLHGKKKPAGFQERLRAANLGKRHTDETKNKIRDIILSKSTKQPAANIGIKIKRSRVGIGIGRKWSEESLAKVTETRKLLLWINNGSINKRVREEDLIKFPDFTKGRLKTAHLD